MYTLAIVYRLPWKMAMETIGKSSRNGSFSIAMLIHVKSPGYHWNRLGPNHGKKNMRYDKMKVGPRCSYISVT